MAFDVSYIYDIQDRYSGVLARIQRRTQQFQRTLKRTNETARKLGDRLQKTGRNAREMGEDMAFRLTLPIKAAALAAGITSVKFEDAFTGVRKTVDATLPQLAKMRGEFEDMSTRIPIAAVELFRIGEAAGQLGIQTKNISNFAEVMAKLGVTTNLVAEEGAQQMARFSNIVQMNEERFSNLGSTVVELGNNMATTEAEIMAMAMRLAGAGHQIRLRESDILALAASLSSVGIFAEAGGTAFSRVMLKMNDAVSTNGVMVRRFAKISGMSVKNFADLFKKDAGKAIVAFINGLARLQKEGKNLNAILAAVEFKEIRVRDALLRSAGAGDLMTKALVMANKAWKDNTALTKEANLRFGTSGSKLRILYNRFLLVSKAAGDILVPQFIKIANKVLPMLERFKSLDEKQQSFILKLIAIAGAIPPLIVAFGAIAASIAVLVKAFAAVGAIAAAVLAGWPVLLIGALVALKLFGQKFGWFNKIIDHTKTRINAIREQIMLLKNALSERFFGALDAIKSVFTPGYRSVMETRGALGGEMPRFTPPRAAAPPPATLDGEIRLKAEHGTSVSSVDVMGSRGTNLNFAAMGSH